MTSDTLERLAAARPLALDPIDVASDGAREHLLASIIAAPAQAHRRRHPVVSAAAASAAGAAAAAAAIVLAAGAPPVPERPGATTTAVAPNDPRLLDQVELAVAQGAAGILRIQSDYGNGVEWETWLDETDQRWRSTSRTPEGRLLYEHQIQGGADGTTVVVVSHQDRAWWTYTAPDWREPSKLYLTPEEIRAQLDDGTLREVPRQPDDGANELRLRGEASEKAPGVYTAAIDLWVDAQTYLPTRLRASLRGGQAATATYTWLARTQDSLDNTKLEPPANYRHLPGAPTQVEPEPRG